MFIEIAKLRVKEELFLKEKNIEVLPWKNLSSQIRDFSQISEKLPKKQETDLSRWERCRTLYKRDMQEHRHDLIADRPSLVKCLKKWDFQKSEALVLYKKYRYRDSR